MARDFDYNDFDAPELVQPIPVQEEPVDRDEQPRVRRRQSSRSRSLDDQFETFDQQRPVYSTDPNVDPAPSRNNTQQRSNSRGNNNTADNFNDFDNFADSDNYSETNQGYSDNRNNYSDTRTSRSNNNGDYYNGDTPNRNGYPGTNNGGSSNSGAPYNTYDNNNGNSGNNRSNSASNTNRRASISRNRDTNNTGSNGSYNGSSNGSYNGSSSNSNTNTRANNQRQQTRRSGNQRQAPEESEPQSQRQSSQPQQRRERVRRSFPKISLIEFFKDTRTHKFLGVLLITAAALITIFTFSHFKNATADQAATATHTIAQIAQQPDLVANAGGPVGAKTGHLLITRSLGLGSLVIIVYMVLLGLGLLGFRKIKFWSLTFKCLLIAITTSVVLGFIFEGASTGIYWGGEHGLAVNGWLHDHMGWIGQAAVSFLLIAAVVIVYSEELARFINHQKEIYQARRQRLAFEQDQEQRRQEAVEESRSSIGEDDDQEGYESEDEQYDGNDNPDDQYQQVGYQDNQAQSQGTYQPQQAYQPQQGDQIRDDSTDPTRSQGFVFDEELDSRDQQARDSQNSPDSQNTSNSSTPSNTSNSHGSQYPQNSNSEALVPVRPANTSDVANSQNGTDSQSGFIAPEEEIPFAIDEQDIETVPVSIDVVGNEPSQDQDVPMEISVNDIETVAADEVQPDYDPTAELSRYHKPSLDLLIEHSSTTISVDADEMEANKQMIISTLRNYGIEISSIEATVGPTVTLFEVVPADGVRISAIKRLEDDIARSLSAIGIRIITPMPGKNTVGLEVPNRVPQIVSMRSILSSRAYQETKARLPMAMGTTITNEVFIEDLTKMPHLLVAGATGQGKSVGLNAIITSLLYKKHPSELKFVMVDPKMVEFSLYSKIEKHFLAKLPEEDDPIITDCDKVKQTLNSLCVEMDDRYVLLKDAFVRSLEEYNAKFVKHRLNPEKGHRYLPYIVVVVDEFADLIMMAGKDIEQPIARIAQKARAVGIHLIIATQRPSTNVITGIIKANFPGRIAFKVSQMVDSRTILDRTGANQLIGKGDMLVMRDGKLERVQCAFVSTEEVEAICDDISSQVGYDHAYYLPDPNENQGGANGSSADMGGPAFGDRDSMFEECARFIVMQDTASTSMLQRRFSIGYNKAGRIMDQLEAAGIVSAANGQKPRMVLVDPDQLENMLGNL